MAGRLTSSRRWGSSPHTRGTRTPRGSRRSRQGDHPRIRGEHDIYAESRRRRAGIIPAYAGNTTKRLTRPLLSRGSSPHTRGTRRKEWCRNEHPRDHPRIRGEHEIPQIDAAFAWGIIPAYAGNTWFSSLCVNLTPGSSPHTRGTRCPREKACRGQWDHPRIRGEHAVRRRVALVVAGIIPAYAGNTMARVLRFESKRGSSPHTRGTRCLAWTHRTHMRDHPRIRGEHLAVEHGARQVAGIIPAYAGNTLSNLMFEQLERGSSPHTRGTRLLKR